MSMPPSEERVFISYATKDFQFVERLRGDLRNSNIPYWIDREGLQAGTPNWEKAIRSAITKAPAVIYVVSPNSFDSLFVRDEISIAQMYDRPIYPVWAFGDTWMKCVPMGLGQVQYADARGEHYEQGVSKLLQALRGVFPDLAITPKIVKPPAEGVERRNPYKGLKAFKEEDARDFFGRTAMIAALR
ncbi:MAG: toll/interleukin-1 receptor domain-containing protein, partial [Anaerolinea sp.]|nr:toll/interleukin-1 receptor domain-containing protein [Anaerolinea sp.]